MVDPRTVFASTLARDRWGRLHDAVRFAFPQRHSIGFIILLVLGVAAVNAVEPLIIAKVIDELTGQRRERVLILALAMLTGFAFLREAMDARANWLTWRTRIGLQYALLEATIGKLHTMPLRLQRSEGVGAIMTRLDRSIQGFTTAVTVILFNVLPSIIFLCIALWIMFDPEWRMALIVLLFAPIPALIARRAAPEQTSRERTLLERWAHIYSRFNEVLSDILIVRSFAMEDAEKSRFLRDVREANQVVIRGVAADAGYGAASNLVIAAARLWAIGFGGWLALRGDITAGTVVAFLGYVGGLLSVGERQRITIARAWEARLTIEMPGHGVHILKPD